MAEDLIQLDRALRAEADDLLDGRGLRDLLGRYGRLHVTGSYALRLMAWRDLDLYLEIVGDPEAELPVGKFFDLGRRMAELLEPSQMRFRNTRLAAVASLPPGLYWGTYLGDIRRRAWKIDLWALDVATCRRLLARCDETAARLTPEARRTILAIKSECWQDEGYRKAFCGEDIYRAVLDEGVRDIEGFRRYLPSRQARSDECKGDADEEHAM